MNSTRDTTFDQPGTVNYNANVAERIFAWFFSIVLHPVFIPVYIVLFLLYVHPTAFAGFSPGDKRQTFFIILLNLVFFPLLSVFLLKALGFVGSIKLNTRKDRIIPYIATGIFFFWAYTVFKEQRHYPLLLTSFILGIFLASSAALLANIYIKISMHAIGIGGMLAFMLIVLREGIQMPWLIAAAVLLTGIVCTARLIISDHSNREIIIGLLVGIITQWAAAIIIL